MKELLAVLPEMSDPRSMDEPRDALSEDPWQPPPGKFYVVRAAGSVAGWRRLAQEAGEADMIDFATAPRPKRR